MNTRSQIPRGNKLFLPKIEYAKLAEDRSFGGERPNIKPPLGEDEKSNAVIENGEKIPLLNREYDMGTFTRFSVLPPIKDSVRNARRLSRTRRFSSSLSFNGPSAAANHETNKRGDEAKPHKYVEFSSMLAQQRRDSYADSGNNLEVVGRPYTRGKRGKTRETGQRRFKARPPQRSFSSPVSSEASESSCKGCQILLTRQRSKTEGEKRSLDNENSKDDALIHTCKKKEEFPGQILNRSSSDNVNIIYRKNDNIHPSGRRKDSNLTSKQSEKASLLTASFPIGRRPVSRCEISVDVSPPVSAEQRSQEEDQQLHISPPSVRIETPENAQGEKTALSPQGTPRIQILIDSLENAREELPKGGGEVPYTSLREKRRRSALCRNNSKQVDDFLLVHNLRDLGLL
ncbi:hypothetical protein ACROYT_G010069 [Oculina patagonica]